ncbi:unnamed protein product [Heligmosomoides polygyrus]|uniref:MULE transposase domain-containing protein n=1 Tax=Heligmosomoides polygyrus TaxID=6339 RepID=A0A3P8E7C3_HELPZ|nr:unnamed protein product [Heligmosomoides polygyrus]
MEREGIGGTDAVYVTGVSCSVLNTPPIDRRCFADVVDEMEDEEERPQEWWDEQERGPPILQAELERKGMGESTVRQWRGGEKYLNYDLYKEHGRFLLDVEKSTTIANEEKEATLSHYSDYGKCRVTAYRNLRRHMEREVSMEYVPDHLALNPDGTRFLQYQTADMHMYILLEKIIRVNVRLLYAITNKKTEFIYTKIWTMLKEVIDSTTDHDFNPRILLDFEQASIKAAKRVTWFDGPFAGMWNKWDKDILRTTNIAESYHSQDVPRNRDISSYTMSDVLKGFALMNKVLKIQDA